MARKLTEKDLTLLKKVAPECIDILCSDSGAPFRSILPPLANHLASDESDFKLRLDRLSDPELSYIIELIRNGSESVSCMPPSYASNFVELVGERFGYDAAMEIIGIYEESLKCAD